MLGLIFFKGIFSQFFNGKKRSAENAAYGVKPCSCCCAAAATAVSGACCCCPGVAAAAGAAETIVEDPVKLAVVVLAEAACIAAKFRCWAAVKAATAESG